MKSSFQNSSNIQRTGYFTLNTKNLNTYGCCTKVSVPINNNEAPALVYQALNVEDTSANGKPDEKPNKNIYQTLYLLMKKLEKTPTNVITLYLMRK